MGKKSQPTGGDSLTEVDVALEAAIRAATAAGRELNARYDLKFRVEQKESLRDIVVDADRAAEKRAVEVVRASGLPAAILSEEMGHVGDPDAELRWVIDALDGTVNYVSHVPFFSVSVALMQLGEPIVGVIYAPIPNDLYYAARGLGAFKNDRRISVVDQPLGSSLLAAAFSGRGSSPDARSREFRLFQAVNDASRGCLRTGSAALNLAYMAEGRLNGCWGRGNKVWDVAAGLAIANAAGAAVRSRFPADRRDLVDYSVGTPGNAVQLESLIDEYFGIEVMESDGTD